MKQCENCDFYNERFDTMQQSDVIRVGDNTETHYCCLFPNGIPEKIANDEIACNHRVNPDEIKAL